MDATPFDVASEVVTRHDVDRVMAAIEKRPPVLILGGSYAYTPEFGRYIDTHWKYDTTIGGIPIRRLDRSTFTAEARAPGHHRR